MVNGVVTTAAEAERALVLGYAPPRAQPAVAALFALDTALAQLLRTTREPIVGQMRLAWWRERLVALDSAPPPAEPVLQAMAGDFLPHGVTGASLVPMVDGWEELVYPDPPDRAALLRYAGGRGALFTAAATVLGARGEPAEAAGMGWALADLAMHVSDPDLAARARAEAAEPLAIAARARWSADTRMLGALAHVARMDLAGSPAPGSPRRVGRLLWHRLTGR